MACNKAPEYMYAGESNGIVFKNGVFFLENVHRGLFRFQEDQTNPTEDISRHLWALLLGLLDGKCSTSS
jgi:hypothetical protein